MLVDLSKISFGRRRLGAINLEQLETLLESLKIYWDYSKNRGLIDDLKTMIPQTKEPSYVNLYELWIVIKCWFWGVKICHIG